MEHITNLFWAIIGSIITGFLSFYLKFFSSIKTKVRAIKTLHILLGKPSHNINLSGNWRAEYDNELYPKQPCIAQQDVRLYQVGKIVVGEPIHENTNVYISGEIIFDKYFSGVYIDTKNGIDYYGTFQVIYKQTDSTQEMIGYWVGFDKTTNDRIGKGVWKWSKPQNGSISI